MIPVWLLCTERSGSSYIAALLDKIFGENQFEEWFNFAIGSQLYDNYYYHDSSNSITSLPKYAKVIYNQFEKLFGDKDRREIERQLPGIKYIHLRRDDVIGQALSIYFSNISCRWNFTSKDDLEKYRSRKIPYNEAYLLKVYDYAKECNLAWDKFLEGTVSFKIDYSEMKELSKLKSMTDFLGLSIDEKQLSDMMNSIKLMKIDRPETKEYRYKLIKAINENSKVVSHNMVRPKIFI